MANYASPSRCTVTARQYAQIRPDYYKHREPLLKASKKLTHVICIQTSNLFIDIHVKHPSHFLRRFKIMHLIESSLYSDNNSSVCIKCRKRKPCRPESHLMLTAAIVCAWGSLISGGKAAGKEAWQLDLNGAWQVAQSGSDEWIAAKVPGCIHTDLLAAGKIPDPFYRDNEKAVQWVGEANWIYNRDI